MSVYLNYLIESNICLVALTLFYALLLGRETNFNFKRSFLLTGIAASLLFPIIKIPGTVNLIPSISQLLPAYFLPAIVIGDGEIPAASSSLVFTFWAVATYTYFVVAFLLLVLLLVNITRIMIYLGQSNATRYAGKFRVIESPINLPTFSFFHFIFVGNISGFTTEEKEQIIQHEITHATKLHSLDILLVELLKILFWFNPAVHYMKSIFTDIHEFQADQLVVDQGDVNQYCNLLARVAMQSADYPIANHFNNSLTLKRINMMKTAKSKLSRWKIAFIAPLLAGLFIFVACQEQVASASEDEVFSTVDELASPEGGIPAYYDYIAKHLRYPEQARMQGIEGKVLVEFIVDKDGSIKEAKALEGIGAGCDKEAVRVIAASSKWNPAEHKGKVVQQRMVLPITFKLN